MAAFIDFDSRGLFVINDLTLEELQALARAIGHADLPDRGTLERMRKMLEWLPNNFTTMNYGLQSK